MPRYLTLADLAASVEYLTTPMRVTRNEAPGPARTITLPSLIDQLDSALMPGQAGGFDGGSSATGSRVPLRIDAVDAILDLERTVDHWTVTLGLATRGALSSDLRQILGRATTCDPATIDNIAADVHRILTIARTATDWESLPWRPNAKCPICERRATLRVRFTTRTAYCTHCGQHWTPDTLEDLGASVREQTSEATA